MGEDLVMNVSSKIVHSPIDVTDFEHGHIGNNDLQRRCCVPVPMDFIGKLCTFSPGGWYRYFLALKWIPAALQHLCAKLCENTRPVL